MDKHPWDVYLGHFDVIRLVMTDFFNDNNTAEKAIFTIKLCGFLKTTKLQ